MGGVRNYFEATPPPGSWFAAQAARRAGVQVASNSESDNAGPDGDDDSGKSPTSSSKTVVASAGKDDDVRDLHKVERGESLRSIARQYGVSISALKSANRLTSDASVRTGMVLAIPSS